MGWSNDYISFGSEDHLDTELFERNLPFVIKIPIGRHKVTKTLIDTDALLNLMMRNAFIEMGLNLADLTPVHDMLHEIIPGQSSTPIDLEVSCGTGENKCMEMLMFEVASFDIGYNCILWRPFLLKFMAAIHTAYATIKMPDPKGVITLKSDQHDALACENEALTHAEKFSEKEAQDLAAKVAKTYGAGTPARTATPGPLAGNTPKTPAVKKSTMVAPTSNQLATDQLVADEKKGGRRQRNSGGPQ
jgi:hypothetical protein